VAVIAEAPHPLTATGKPKAIWVAIRRNPTIFIGTLVLALLALMAIFAPLIAGDPLRMATAQRLRPPSEAWWFGTDQYGRDVYARTIYGARVSLVVGITVALAASAIGLVIGLVCGYF